MSNKERYDCGNCPLANYKQYDDLDVIYDGFDFRRGLADWTKKDSPVVCGEKFAEEACVSTLDTADKFASSQLDSIGGRSGDRPSLVQKLSRFTATLTGTIVQRPFLEQFQDEIKQHKNAAARKNLDEQ